MTSLLMNNSHSGVFQQSSQSNVQLSASVVTAPAALTWAGHSRDPSPDSDDEPFVYPGHTSGVEGEHMEFVTLSETVSPRRPSPAQLEALYAAAASGDLPLLQKLFQTGLQSGNVEAFALANEASTRTGSTALHAAASRGYIEIVKWLIEDCGAIPGLEDKEGETALHKAALSGHLDIIGYLLPEKADVHARDNDGWTALHNACSKGYLDIVRWLCESGGATSEWNGVPGVDIKSTGGWTPLMNAASKGHLPVVFYLLNKQSADPLTRNNWGETAYDVAAAVFEIWICEILRKAEAVKWRRTTVQYDPLAVHTTVPLIVFENQYLDTRLKTLAVSGGRPKFSASGLGKPGRYPAFELKLPKPDEETGARTLPASRNDIQLPLRDRPWTISFSKQGPSMEGAERSHFWLSDWTLDVTDPKVDVEEGWQYAHSFTDPCELWTAEHPPQLKHLLIGGSVVSGLSTPSGSTSSSRLYVWVRRRRWVRVMRRRLDIPPLPFLEPDGSMYHLTEDGHLTPCIQDGSGDVGSHDGGDNEGQELGSLSSAVLSSTRDYVARAKYLVGNHTRETENPPTAIEVRRAIAKLERATTELRFGILADGDTDRKTQAEVLLNAYSRELERRRLSANSQGLLISEDGEGSMDEDGDSSDEEFHYPGSSPLEAMRPPSVFSNATNQPDRASARFPTDLTAHLSQAPDFRVPTHEAPQKVVPFLRNSPTPYQAHAQWEPDDAVLQCRQCQRRFTFLYRRHCRKCGRIFCDACSSWRASLEPSDVVHDPTFHVGPSTPSMHRVCRSCFDVVNAPVPNALRGARTNSLERVIVEQEGLNVTHLAPRRQSSSQLSDLSDCPVCNRRLEELGGVAEQEEHIRQCLDGDSTSPQVTKYLVYKLPAESTLIGIECEICLEEFTKGSTVARLSCFCSFHNDCLSSWLKRGKSCPVHAR